MLYYVYDGSFTGFLTLMHRVLSDKIIPGRISSSDCYQPDLFSQSIIIETDSEKADRAAEAIIKEISRKSYRAVYRCFLSEIDGFEKAAAKFIYRGFKSGERIYQDWTDPDAAFVKRAERKVNRELHRYQGLLRFRMLESKILYAPYRPEHNISSLLARHFSRRLAAERWIIHDRGRNTAVIYSNREWLEIPAEELKELKYAGEEEQYQKLWIKFFESISIKTRKNLKAQSRFMPEKCREFLIDKENNIK